MTKPSDTGSAEIGTTLSTPGDPNTNGTQESDISKPVPETGSASSNPIPVRKPVCDPPSLDEEVTDILRRIQKARKRPLFVLIADMIEDTLCEEVYRWGAELKAASGENSIDILIHSPGGVLTDCYRTARLFSYYVDSWEALVPSMAMSGATLICLGSSRIVLTSISRLGPMDPQVISKRPSRFYAYERQSPLEAFEALKYLREFSLTELNVVLTVLQKRGVAPQTALETATTLATQLVSAVVAKIDPYELGAFQLDSNLAANYCRRICDPADPQKKTQRRVRYNFLVEEYPAHEFVIDLAEAASLGFNVCEPDEDVAELFDELRGHLDNITRYVGLVQETGVTP